MTGTFGSLNIAKSGLQYQQIAMDIANSNVANASTDGYVRRRAIAAEVGGPSQPAMWSTYSGHGEGVTTAGVSRLTDQLLEARVRREHGTLAYLQAQQTSLTRVESGIGEPGANGVAAALDDFKSSWEDLANDPGNAATRQSVLGKAQTLVQSIHTQAQNIDDEMSDQRVAALNDVNQINDDAAQLADLNKSIRTAELNGSDTGVLMDQRDALAKDLATLSGAVVTVDGDGNYNVSINGASLVNGQAAQQIQPAWIAPDGSDTGASLGFQITQADGDPTNLDVISGDLGGVVTLVNKTLKDYRAGLDSFAGKLAQQVNGLQSSGQTLDGQTPSAFFTIDTSAPDASKLELNITDPNGIAAATPGKGDLDGSNADAISKAITAGADYQQLVSGFGAKISAVDRQVTNQQALVTQVDDEREQSAGVNLDEEAINLVAAQRSYEASARVLTVLDSMLDTLINHTGVTH